MPRKLGQHFLLHEPVLKRLAEAACGEHTQRMVEIGPGRGAFTKHLLPLVDELHVIEVDENLVQHLQHKFANETKLTIHHADVLQVDLAQWGEATVVGNLPYYITSPIIQKFLKLGSGFDTAVFMMQHEVALRLAAKRMSRDFGYLTVSTQLVTDVEIVMKIHPKAFNPPPKVDSAAVRLKRKSEIPSDLPEILDFTQRCLRQKRKTLRNNLRGTYGTLVDRQPEGFMRAEQLGTEGLVAFYRRLRELTKTGAAAEPKSLADPE